MELVRSRNPQSAMSETLNLLYRKGEKVGENLVMPEPVSFIYEKPRERLIFWPSFQRNPSRELHAALSGIRQIEKVIGDAAKEVMAGKTHFIFSNPQIVVQAHIDRSNRFHMRTVAAETNPFLGALGNAMLQLSILQELMANSIDHEMGTFTMLHMTISVKADFVEKLLKESLDGIPDDPYQHGLKTRKIDGNINIAMLLDEGARAAGYRSKWTRCVALPVFLSSQGRDFDESMKRTKDIKADDWRRLQIEYLRALNDARILEEQKRVESQPR